VLAWKTANAVQVTDQYARDALVMYPNQPGLNGKSEILAYFKSFFSEFQQEEFELTSVEIEVAGPWAFDRGTYRWKGVPRAGGEPIEDYGKYLVILQRQGDGTFRVARDMDNSDKPLTQSTRGVR
jgi:ketosteroid isomerase-like protein